MKVYRNHPGSEADGSAGYAWFYSEHEAIEEAAKNPGDYTWDSWQVAKEFEVKCTKEGVLKFLNVFACYPDNG